MRQLDRKRVILGRTPIRTTNLHGKYEPGRLFSQPRQPGRRCRGGRHYPPRASKSPICRRFPMWTSTTNWSAAKPDSSSVWLRYPTKPSTASWAGAARQNGKCVEVVGLPSRGAPVGGDAARKRGHVCGRDCVGLRPRGGLQLRDNRPSDQAGRTLATTPCV